MVTDASEGWEAVEEKLDQAITEVMLTDGWRDAPTLVILESVIERDAPLPARVKAKRLMQLLELRVPEMTEEQTIELSNELVGLLRFVCHRGDEDV
ncbi:MAG TPA: hypothetical protein VJN18_14755 [Polyangiaceae bacterium]|nr:hypothetical protein [Polyangiaceae bacterium]